MLLEHTASQGVLEDEGKRVGFGGHMQEFGLLLPITEGEGTNKLVLYFSKNSSSDRIKVGIIIGVKN